MFRERARCAALLAALALSGALAGNPRAAAADERLYQWSLAGAGAGAATLHLLYERHDGGSTRSESRTKTVSLADLRGLPPGQLAAWPAGAQHFDLVEDAGKFACEGTVGNGRGSGTYRFVPDPSFVRELARRSIPPARDDELLILALGNFKLATLDAALAAGFQRPTLADLSDLVDHGVTADYVSSFKDVGLTPKSVRDLGALRDHGARPELVRALAASSYRGLSAAEIGALADHGVTGSYIAALDHLGFHPSLAEIARLRDNGVSASFIQRVRAHGYRSMSADDIIKLYEHGV